MLFYTGYPQDFKNQIPCIFKEFSEFVDSLATNNGHLLILGDFNIHWDCQRNADTKQLADILRSANLRQHVQERTHRHGHILDLVISRDDDNLIKAVYVSSMLSDHLLININVSLQKQSVSAKVRTSTFKDKGNGKKTNPSMVQ